MSAKARRRAAERQAIVDRIEAHGYSVRFVEFCEDEKTPGWLTMYAGVTDHRTREVKIRARLPHDRGGEHEWTCAVLRHELEHVEGAERGTDYPALGLVCGGRGGF